MNEKPKPGATLGTDVQVIRDILFGEHLDRFQQRVDALEMEIDLLKRENKNLLKELDAVGEKRFQDMATRVEKRFQDLADRLEQVVSEHAGTTAELRGKLEDMSKHLLVSEERQGVLIASLGKILMEYKTKSGK